MIANFTVTYTEISTSELLLLQSQMEESGYLGSLPVKLLNISAATGILIARRSFHLLKKIPSEHLLSQTDLFTFYSKNIRLITIIVFSSPNTVTLKLGDIGDLIECGSYKLKVNQPQKK